ncbi:MAG: DUF1622 domain-containing protein [Motilibacteraceae bacterium]
MHHAAISGWLLAEGGGLSSVLPEEGLRTIVDLLVRLVEAGGALVIAVGALVAFVRFLLALRHSNPDAFVPVRLVLGRFLALGLEFQLAGDVLRTAIAPTYQEIGKLAAIAAIRTLLNFFLAREITEERRVVDDEHAVQRKAAAADGHSGASVDVRGEHARDAS